MSDESRSIGGNLYLCPKCKIAFNARHQPKSYDTEYFTEEYRSQYGKTYIEDFENITALSKRRLISISKYLKSIQRGSELSLLDIGSAAGFFLKTARDNGIASVTGIEISEFAARYCRDHFNIPVIRQSFDGVTLESMYTIITAWFFIEHAADTVGTIKKIFGALSPGGIFACSVPSIFGPSYHFHRAEWIDTHPSDHLVNFTPAGARILFKRCGFRKIYVHASGIHPERILNQSSLLFRPFSRIYRIFSRVTGYSDTIEIYALK